MNKRLIKHIISFSGGKDSTAMLIRMIELGMQIDEILFADTGVEFPEMYDYIREVEIYIGRKIKVVKPKHSFEWWFYRKYTRGQNTHRIRGFPYVIQGCWWAKDCKTGPLTKAEGKGNVVYIGIANDEKKRTNRKIYQNQKNQYKFPLIEWGWSEQKCLSYLKEKGLHNPLYNKFHRLGCWLCPKQRISELRVLYEDYPELWEKLKILEGDSPQGFKPNIRLIDLENKWKYQTKLNTIQQR